MHHPVEELQTSLPTSSNRAWQYMYIANMQGYQEGHRAKVWCVPRAPTHQYYWEVKGWPFVAIAQTPANRCNRWFELATRLGWEADRASALRASVQSSELSTQRKQKRKRCRSLDLQEDIAEPEPSVENQTLPEQAVPTELFLLLLVRSTSKYKQTFDFVVRSLILFTSHQ